MVRCVAGQRRRLTELMYVAVLVVVVVALLYRPVRRRFFGRRTR